MRHLHVNLVGVDLLLRPCFQCGARKRLLSQIIPDLGLGPQ